MYNDFTLVSVPLEESDIRKRCCCNCRHNMRVKQKDNPIMIDHNECEIDGHNIRYVDYFDGWCRHWSKERD